MHIFCVHIDNVKAALFSKGDNMKAIEALKIASDFHYQNDKVEVYARIENAAQNGHFSITVFALSEQMEQDLIDNGYILERNQNEDGVVETIDIVWQYAEHY